MTRPSDARDPRDDVRLQVLLKPEWRNARGVADVEHALRALGFEVTGAGRASISARAAPETARHALGGTPDVSRQEAAAGRADLPVPASLAGQVQSITVAPHHTAMSTPARPGRRRGRT